MKSDFHKRKQRRIERYEELAEKNQREASQRFDRAHNEVAAIPFGQPILVGHHSEGRHRAALKRHDQNMRKGIEAKEKAAHYAGRAASAESNDAVFSDDPDAIEKLRVKITRAERTQAMMRETNKLVRKHKAGKLSRQEYIDQAVRHVLTPAVAEKLLEPDFCGRVGFPDYAMSNNNANIRRMKQRLAMLEDNESRETTETTRNGVRLVESVEDNRLQLYFDGKPSADVRAALKSNGFRWARSLGCWQRHLSNGARYAAERVVDQM